MKYDKYDKHKHEKHDRFGVRRPDTPEGRDSVSMLVNRMYAWRGYGNTHDVGQDPNRITLTATDKGEVVGTLSIGIDSPAGLRADEIFKEELDVYRARGARLCEITKLAFDHSVQSKVSLANLFHLSIIYSRDIHHCTDLFIEINPRHRRFYERMLGFQQVGELRMNQRVNAPAHLLYVNMDYVTEQIKRYGGTYGQNTNASVRSFYCYFFAEHEERAIINRLLRIEGDGDGGEDGGR